EEKEEKRSSALFWLLPLLALLLLGVFVLQMKISNTVADRDDLDGYGQGQEYVESEEQTDQTETSQGTTVADPTGGSTVAINTEEAGAGTEAVPGEELDADNPNLDEVALREAQAKQQGQEVAENSETAATSSTSTEATNNASESSTVENSNTTGSSTNSAANTSNSKAELGDIAEPGWYAVVGVFGNKRNANKLRNRLRKKGEPAYADEVPGKTYVMIYAGTTEANSEGKLEDVRRKYEKTAWLKEH
ncbi:SPOR domain-containing protein, partial [Chitinophagales bacterium]|nr:SPOR domain-containing protein [Chitinophagales bacterium]